MRILEQSLLVLAVCGLASVAAARVATNKTDELQREGKVFNLFNVVQFQNTECRSNSRTSGSASGANYRNGTCFTATECRDKGGAASGNCAAGFGVCCVFTAEDSGDEIHYNCSYIQNPNYPNAYDEVSSVMYTVHRCSDQVCSIRLDFETFTIRGTSDTTEMPPAHNCDDTFSVTTTNGFRVPTICGANTGQHMYVDIGRENSDTLQLQFTFDGVSNSRMWDIKVTQIKCMDELLPPEGCLQYHISTTGRFETFNFQATDEVHPPNMDYNICIRQEQGMCCVRYQTCPDARAMTLDHFITAVEGSVDLMCSEDYIYIEDSGVMCDPGRNQLVNHNKYCGRVLTYVHQGAVNVPICDCSGPFMVGIHTDNGGDNAGAANAEVAHVSRGACLVFDQIPC